MNKLLLALIITLGMSFSFSAYSCLDDVTLGIYHFGKWSDADGTIWISDEVGSMAWDITNRKELKKRYRKYVKQCKSKGKRLIRQGQDLFPDQAEELTEWYLEHIERCLDVFEEGYNIMKQHVCKK